MEFFFVFNNNDLIYSYDRFLLRRPPVRHGRLLSQNSHPSLSAEIGPTNAASALRGEFRYIFLGIKIHY